MERQSSMASSTEEVSGNNETISDRTNQHDTTDTEQRLGMYMREFDFLEYELESLEVCETIFIQLPICLETTYLILTAK